MMMVLVVRRSNVRHVSLTCEADMIWPSLAPKEPKEESAPHDKSIVEVVDESQADSSRRVTRSMAKTLHENLLQGLMARMTPKWPSNGAILHLQATHAPRNGSS